VEKIENYTRNEWGRSKTTLERSEEDYFFKREKKSRRKKNRSFMVF
jgi:hypothetical protein